MKLVAATATTILQGHYDRGYTRSLLVEERRICSILGESGEQEGGRVPEKRNNDEDDLLDGGSPADNALRAERDPTELITSHMVTRRGIY